MITKKKSLNNVLLSPRFNERGATMVEFSLVGLIVFGLIGAGIDFGLALWKFSNLTHAMNVAVRDMAIDLASRSGEDCEDLAEDPVNLAAEAEAKKLLLNGTIVLGKNLNDPTPPSETISIVSTITPLTPPTLSITSQMRLDCMFCFFFPKGRPILSTRSEALIENSTFTCT